MRQHCPRHIHLLGPVPVLRLPAALYDIFALLREKPRCAMLVIAGCAVDPSCTLLEIKPLPLVYAAR